MQSKKSEPHPAYETALITGASSGIGAALAHVLSDHCQHLILVARNEQRLNQLAYDIKSRTPCAVSIITADLSLPDAADTLFLAVQRRQLTVDLLINNAGAGQSGEVITQTSAEQAALIALNITTLTHLSRLFAARMVKQGHGIILNIASTGAYQPGPYTAVYYAAKAYVHSFSLALDRELKGTGVHISLLCPGATATEFSQRAGKKDIENAMSPEKVAQIALQGLAAKRKLIIPGWGNRLVIVLSKILPGSLLAAFVAKIQKPLIR